MPRQLARIIHSYSSPVLGRPSLRAVISGSPSPVVEVHRPGWAMTEVKRALRTPLVAVQRKLQRCCPIDRCLRCLSAYSVSSIGASRGGNGGHRPAAGAGRAGAGRVCLSNPGENSCQWICTAAAS
ncbi:hypothetical protein HMPREF0682_0917 [Propionibacterium acidifaciens F0233]|uniref:Uncharacterized protein n=1 Tax=Propionibacterium acidifaciens F0233 TaxID=553198 RepID=U2QCL7_9ACTN|nr:hypothetical protein HMPREF0682_0917 [Propionibacterium acidifaciens F0233]